MVIIDSSDHLKERIEEQRRCIEDLRIQLKHAKQNYAEAVRSNLTIKEVILLTEENTYLQLQILEINNTSDGLSIIARK